MAVHPFGMWHVGDSFYQAVDLEDEEDDQYQEEDEEKIAVYETSPPGVLSGDVLVVCVGTPANMLVETFLQLPSQHHAEIICTTTKQHDKKSNNKETCLLYQMDQIIICQCKTQVPPEDAHKWVEYILSAVQVKSVMVLSSQTKTSYHGDVEAKNSDEDVVRHVGSSWMTENTTIVPRLEHGTVISDIPAAIMSYCEMFAVPAVLYVTFTESHFVDVFTLKTLQVVLGDPLLRALPQLPKSVLAARLRDFEGVGVADNNLYI